MARARTPKGPAPDWYALKARFVEGVTGPNDERIWPTLEDVAAVAGLREATVRDHSRQGAWAAAREDFRAELDGERRRAIFEARKDQLVKIDQRALTAAEGGIALVGRAITALVNAVAQAEANDTPRPRIDGRELSALGLSAKRFMEVKAQAVGQVVASEEETLDEIEKAARMVEQGLAERIQQHLTRRAVPFEDTADATN